MALEQQTLGGFGLRHEIEERGYAEFEHLIPDETIDAAVDAYADFTLAFPDPSPETMSAMLPETSKEFHKRLDDLDRSQDQEGYWHKYRTNVEGVGKPDGYTNRSFQVSALARARGLHLDDDPKEFFHYSRHWLANVSRRHQENEWGPVPPEVEALETRFRPIHQKASELILRIARDIEEVHPGIRDYFSPKDLATSPVRLLFYHPGQSESIGSGHYDKSSLTLQLAESHKGLRIAKDKASDLELITRGADKAAFFAGRRIAEDVDPDTPYQPAWHDIIRTNELNPGRTLSPKATEICARWALIFFANGKDFVNPDKSLTHTR
ncbi:MAG: hypothetical protein U5L95_03100 [Candidatus Saccharibacteria bacterium]|nr:hypothetical protein [Candidatus Saccharibacteria bacterium]